METYKYTKEDILHMNDIAYFYEQDRCKLPKVDFETSLLLKDIGYTNYAINYWDLAKDKYTFNGLIKSNTYDNILTNPYVDEVIDWIYRNHNYWMWAEYDGEGWFSYYNDITNNEREVIGEYDSYFKAKLAGINYFINLKNNGR